MQVSLMPQSAMQAHKASLRSLLVLLQQILLARNLHEISQFCPEYYIAAFARDFYEPS